MLACCLMDKVRKRVKVLLKLFSDFPYLQCFRQRVDYIMTIMCHVTHKKCDLMGASLREILFDGYFSLGEMLHDFQYKNEINCHKNYHSASAFHWKKFIGAKEIRNSVRV